MRYCTADDLAACLVPPALTVEQRARLFAVLDKADAEIRARLTRHCANLAAVTLLRGDASPISKASR